MKSKENIVFLGMMGSGKSSIGSLVSKKLKLNFFDIDRQIENALGMKISKIFETKGEKFFREFEEIIALKILKRNKIVISLGGGTFMNKKVRKEILTKHLSFWLQWDNETLIKRIKNSKKRPIAIQSSNDELLDLIKKRSSIYSKARYKINCNNLTKLEIVEKVLKNL